MTIRARDFDRVIRKFGFQTRESHHLLAWLELDGKIVVRTKHSPTPGSRDLPAQYSIRRQMKLNEDEFRQAVNCSLGRDGYVELLRQKGVIN